MTEYVFLTYNGAPLTYALNGLSMERFYVDDTSYVYYKREEQTEMVLQFTLPEYVDIPVGTQTTYDGETFYVFFAPSVTKTHNSAFKYNITLYPIEYQLTQQLVIDPSLKTAKFSLCGTPTELLSVIIPGYTYSIDASVPSYEIVQQFNYQFRWDALKTLVKTLHTSFEIRGNKTLYVGPTERVQNCILSYGRGKGLLGDLKRTASEKYSPLNRVYIKGGTRNLPVGKTLQPIEGSTTSRNNSDGTKSNYLYKEGVLTCTNDTVVFSSEQTIDLSNIYPHHIGFVSAVSGESVDVDDTPTNCTNKFTDSSNVINYNDYLTDEELTVMFQTGELYGHELKVVKYDHATKTFTLQPEYVDNQLYLAGTFVPHVGDAYIVFHCDVPAKYVSDAQRQLFERAVDYFHECRQHRLSFTTKIDPNWLAVVNLHFAVNDLVHFQDEQMCPVPVQLRVDALKRKLRSYSDELTLATIDRRAELLDTTMTIYAEINSLIEN